MNYFPRTAKIGLIFSVLFSLKTPLIKAAECITDDEREVVRLTNQERTNQQLPLFKTDPILMGVARYSSQYMAQRDQSSHHCVDGKRSGQRVKESGYCDHDYSTEIILTYPLFSKHRDFTRVLKSWMDSPDHREKILSSKEDIGVGLATSGKNTTYFTIVFSTKISPYAKSSPSAVVSSSHVVTVPLKAAATVAKPKLLLSSSSDLDIPDLPSLPLPLSFSSPEMEMNHMSLTLFELINNVRAQATVCSLTTDVTLMMLAEADAYYMASNNVLSHNHGSKTPIDRVIESGFCQHRYSTELISITKDRNMESVVQKWMSSTTGTQILNKNYQVTGVGMAPGKDGSIYIAQVLSRKNPVYI